MIDDPLEPQDGRDYSDDEVWELGNPDDHGHYPDDGDEQYCTLCNPALTGQQPVKRYVGDKPVVEHSIEPENGIWIDMTKDIELPKELTKEDIF